MKEKRPRKGECENIGQELKPNDTVKLTWTTGGRNEEKKCIEIEINYKTSLFKTPYLYLLWEP